MVELVDPENNIGDIEWDEFAKRFPVPLPESFKAHYLRINGGYLAEEDVEADRWGIPVGGFNPIKYGRFLLKRSLMTYSTFRLLIASMALGKKMNLSRSLMITAVIPFSCH
nr:SMI1/KNR4 family protein [Cronobacter turicensis]